MKSRGGFTLIELLLAAAAASLVLLAVYAIFHQAVRVRDSATRRMRDSRVRLRAEKIIRADLRNALVSGGLLASVLQGDSASPDNASANSTAAASASHADASSIPGYLRFTTTTGRNDANTGLYGDVQEVEYYIAHDPNAADQNGSGRLVRSVTRDLLDASGLSSSSPSTSSTNNAAGTTNAPTETTVLSGVQSFQVSFYDGANWQTNWQFSQLATLISPAASASTTSTGTSTSSGATTQTLSGQTSLPDAVRLDIQQAPATPNGPLPPPLEILVPWTTQPFVAATPATASNAAQQ